MSKKRKNVEKSKQRILQKQRLFDIRLYCDDGFSGTNFVRPDFKRMINDAKDGKINTIIVKDLSRFRRNYLKVGAYIREIFPEMGIRFIAI